jgi:HEAT repeat protein
MPYYRLVVFAVAAVLSLPAQEAVKPKDVREIAKAGSNAIPKLQELLKDPDTAVRIEVVKQLTDIGTARSIDPLILATRDNDPEVEMRATDGLVNFYLPGYVKTGITAPVMRVGRSIKGRFTDTNDQVIPSYVEVRPEVIAALGKLATGGGSMDARAGAARALGILRGKAALAGLIEAAHSKDSTVIYESLIAMQKIRDESAAPGIAFLLHDLDAKVQIAAIETTGILRNKQSLPELVAVFNRTRDVKVKRAALSAIAMLPDESSRSLYAQNLRDKDEKLRAAAAEGYARLRKPADLPVLEQAWQEEGKTLPRLALAFAQVMLGKTEISEFSPLKFLINNLSSASYDGVAYPYLVELARNQQVLEALYAPIDAGTKSEKMYLARVLAASGNQSTVPVLRKMSSDPDTEVAQAGLNALRTLQARLQ